MSSCYWIFWAVRVTWWSISYDDFYYGTFIGGINNLGNFVANNNYEDIYIGNQSDNNLIALQGSNYYNSIYGINDSNYFIGNQPGYLPYIHNGVDFITIEYPNSEHTYVSGINDNNLITGYFESEYGTFHIFTYSYNDGTFQVIDPSSQFLPKYINSNFSVGINNSGHILGATIKSPNILYLEN